MSTLPPSTYGADASGLIYGFQFGALGQGIPVDTAQAL